MDKSETYIKMCDCEEIQGIPIYPDRPIPKYNNPTEYLHFCGRMWLIRGDRAIWLPSQEELQEMYFNIPKEGLIYCGNWFYDIAPKLLERLCNFLLDYKVQLFSMEQLWLAFVMKEENKVWDGTEWIKED